MEPAKGAFIYYCPFKGLFVRFHAALGECRNKIAATPVIVQTCANRCSCIHWKEFVPPDVEAFRRLSDGLRHSTAPGIPQKRLCQAVILRVSVLAKQWVASKY